MTPQVTTALCQCWVHWDLLVSLSLASRKRTFHNIKKKILKNFIKTLKFHAINPLIFSLLFVAHDLRRIIFRKIRLTFLSYLPSFYWIFISSVFRYFIFLSLVALTFGGELTFKGAALKYLSKELFVLSSAFTKKPPNLPSPPPLSRVLLNNLYTP